MGNKPEKPTSENTASPQERVMSLWNKIRRYSSVIARVRLVTSKSDGTRSLVKNIESEDGISIWERILIYPDNQYKRAFDLLIALLILMDIVLSSYNFFLITEPVFVIINDVLTCLFFFDIVFNFVQVYRSGSKQIVSPKAIALHYLQTYFVLDFVATLPLYHALENLYWLRLIRVFRFDVICSKIIIFLSQSIIEPVFSPTKPTISAISRLMRFVLTLIISLHIFACIWANIGKETGGWVHKTSYLLSSNSDLTIYLTALYWASTVFATVGYGEFVGYTTLEYVFSMFVFLFGVCMFSYLLGNVNGLVAQMNAEENLKSQQAEELEEWLLRMDRMGKSKRITGEQIDFITKYMQNYWRLNLKNMDTECEFVRLLPPRLRRTLLMDHLFVGTRQKFKRFFEGHSPDFIRRLILKMEYCMFGTGQQQGLDAVCIQKSGTIPKMAYFIISGKLQLCSFDGLATYMELEVGAVYGEAFILFSIPTTYTLKYDPFFAKTDHPVDLYKVEAADFLGILKDYRCVYETLRDEGLKKRGVYRSFKRKAIARLDLPSLDKQEPDVASHAEEKKEEESPRKNTEEPLFQPAAEEPIILVAEEEKKLDTLKPPNKAPAGTTNVFSLFRGEKQPETEEKHESFVAPEPSFRKSPRSKAKIKLFDAATRKELDHNSLLALEYEYDSEEEFGRRDVFQRKQVIKDPKKVNDKIDKIQAELDALNEAVDKMDSALEEQLETVKDKALIQL